MKLYETKSSYVSDDLSTDNSGHFRTDHFKEYTASADTASKARTRLKKMGHEMIKTEEVEVDARRDGLIKFLNERLAHESWVSGPVAAALGG